MADIGRAIAQARKAAGLQRQGDLATLIGVDVSAISRYESGRSRPSDETVVRIEEVLGLPRGQLLVDAGLVDGGPPAPKQRSAITRLAERIAKLGPEDRDYLEGLITHMETRPR